MKKRKSYLLKKETLNFINDFYYCNFELNDTEKLEGILNTFKVMYNNSLNEIAGTLAYNEWMYLTSYLNRTTIDYQANNSDFIYNLIKNDDNCESTYNVDKNNLIHKLNNNFTDFQMLVLLRELSTNHKVVSNNLIIDKSTITSLIKVVEWSEYKAECIEFMSIITFLENVGFKKIDSSVLINELIENESIQPNQLEEHLVNLGYDDSSIFEIINNKPIFFTITVDNHMLNIFEDDLTAKSLNTFIRIFLDEIYTYQGPKKPYEVEEVYATMILKLTDNLIPSKYFYCKNATNLEEAINELSIVDELWINENALSKLSSDELEELNKTIKFKDKVLRWSEINIIEIK